MQEFYRGEVKSALQRCRKLLKGVGIPMSRKIGRYSPFGGTQVITHGAVVSQVGCSEWIAVHYTLGPHGSASECRRLRDEACAILKAAGLPLDERGWILCLTECYRCHGFHTKSMFPCKRPKR